VEGPKSVTIGDDNRRALAAIRTQQADPASQSVNAARVPVQLPVKFFQAFIRTLRQNSRNEKA
jgi:hypothetical protein